MRSTSVLFLDVEIALKLSLFLVNTVLKFYQVSYTLSCLLAGVWDLFAGGSQFYWHSYFFPHSPGIFIFEVLVCWNQTLLCRSDVQNSEDLFYFSTLLERFWYSSPISFFQIDLCLFMFKSQLLSLLAKLFPK